MWFMSTSHTVWACQSHRRTHAHTYTHSVDGHTHISCNGQSHFIKLTPDQSQMHWRRTNTYTSLLFPSMHYIQQTRKWRGVAQKKGKGQKVTATGAETCWFQFLPSLSPSTHTVLLYSRCAKGLLVYKFGQLVCLVAVYRSRGIYLTDWWSVFTVGLTNNTCFSIWQHLFEQESY